jgi:FSR family fosmidomycin resistance protein-like MFS transporter
MTSPEVTAFAAGGADTGPERRGRNALAATVIAGHALKHLYLSGMQSIVLPEIKIAFGLSGTQLGTLATVRQFSGWATTMGAGYLGDRFSSRTGLMLAASMTLMGGAYFLVGLSSGFAFLFVALLLAGIGPSMYHPPAIGALSRKFPDRRALAISLHGTGGSVGEALGPVVASGLLLLLTWRGLLQLSLLPALVAAFLVWRVMSNLKLDEGGVESFLHYVRSLLTLLANKALLLLVLITALRSMGQSSITIFLPVYLREDLDYSATSVGLYLSLAQFVGIGSQPVMGYLSDRLGHKTVLLPAMAALGALCILLRFAEGEAALVLTVVALGAFLYSLHSIFISAAIGVVGESSQATTVSLIYAASFLGTLSPIVAGVLADDFGTRSTFLYGAALVFAGTVVLGAMRLPRAEPRITALH